MMYPDSDTAQELARDALRWAVSTRAPDDGHDEVIDAARAYYAFLTNPAKSED